jgi:hypothetical protein
MRYTNAEWDGMEWDGVYGISAGMDGWKGRMDGWMESRHICGVKLLRSSLYQSSSTRFYVCALSACLRCWFCVYLFNGLILVVFGLWAL